MSLPDLNKQVSGNQDGWVGRFKKPLKSAWDEMSARKKTILSNTRHVRASRLQTNP